MKERERFKKQKKKLQLKFCLLPNLNAYDADADDDDVDKIFFIKTYYYYYYYFLNPNLKDFKLLYYIIFSLSLSQQEIPKRIILFFQTGLNINNKSLDKQNDFIAIFI